MDKYDNKYRFGGNREKVLIRDNYSCRHCGMTNEEHIKAWGKQITVDHIDGNGRNVKISNNNINNLMTLCLRCHSRKDAFRRHKANKTGWDRYGSCAICKKTERPHHGKGYCNRCYLKLNRKSRAKSLP